MKPINDQAAEAIIRLINSKPDTPTVRDITTVLGKYNPKALRQLLLPGLYELSAEYAETGGPIDFDIIVDGTEMYLDWMDRPKRQGRVPLNWLDLANSDKPFDLIKEAISGVIK